MPRKTKRRPPNPIDAAIKDYRTAVAAQRKTAQALGAACSAEFCARANDAEALSVVRKAEAFLMNILRSPTDG